MKNVISLLFGFTEQVNRKSYLVSGIVLAIVKYALDFGVIWFTQGKVWSLIAYLSPVATIRGQEISSSPDTIMWIMAVYSLPFAWIGVSMSIRRAANAGLSPWIGLAFLIPIVNYVLIIALCAIPTRADWRPDNQDVVPLPLSRALLAIGIGVSLTLSMVATSVYVLGDYGWSLFIATPFIVGAVAGFLVNRDRRSSLAATCGVAGLAIVLSGVATLLFAVEGAICIAMAAPPVIVIAVAGSVVGRAIAGSNLVKQSVQLVVVCLALPFLAGAESMMSDRSLEREVITSVEIDAPPAEVWHHVVNFTELDPPHALVFKTGIAYPIRAKLVGEGVGAVRYCEFSTGPFVEPITTWEPGVRLSFDVESQPAPMQEWSPYTAIHPPHLDGYFRSKRGEFRFVDLGNDRTRLEGSTWYELDLAPFAYWSFLSDALLHRIHTRVLNHVKRESEKSR